MRNEFRGWVAVGLLSAAAGVQATSYDWPGAAPCGAAVSLQGCINAVGANDTVNVVTSATIDVGSQLVIDKPLTLQAAPGYRPVLAAPGSIRAAYTPAPGTNWSLTLDGFTLLDGAVGVTVGEGNATVTLRRLDVTTLAQSSIGPGGGPNSGIGLRIMSGGSATYEVAGNRVRTSISNVGQPHAFAADSSGGALDGRIHDNRFSNDGAQAGIAIVLHPQGASTTRIWSNQIGGTQTQAISIFPLNASVTHTFVVADNAITCGGMGFALIPVAPGVGTLSMQIFNNTLVGCQTGFTISNSGAVNGRIANNLIAYNGSGLNLGTFGATVSNDHNLIFGNANNNYVPGPGTVTADPLLRRGAADPRPAANSPAVDAADTPALRALLAAYGMGAIDADGSRRFKGSANLADIGAFEAGDASLAQRKVAATSSYSTILHPALVNNANALPLVTATRMADSYPAASNLHYVGLDYLAPNWQVHNEGSTLFTANSAFDVFVPAAGDGSFLHGSTAANVSGTFTRLDDPTLNGQGNRIVLATHRPGTAFDEPFAVAYFLNSWLLLRTAGGNFPVGLDFHVYAQEPSLNAFHWVIPETGTTSWTVLDNLTINGEPCAQIHVTQGAGHVNVHPIELRYVSALKRWRIENTDNVVLGAGSDFFVYVDEAATVACRYEHLFHDEFEVRD